MRVKCFVSAYRSVGTCAIDAFYVSHDTKEELDKKDLKKLKSSLMSVLREEEENAPKKKVNAA